MERKHAVKRALFGLAAVVLAFSAPFGRAASQPAKVTIHIPSKSLSLMPFYFGKDKGFFPREVIDIQLVAMGPPTAIAALVAGEILRQNGIDPAKDVNLVVMGGDDVRFPALKGKAIHATLFNTTLLCV